MNGQMNYESKGIDEKVSTRGKERKHMIYLETILINIIKT